MKDSLQQLSPASRLKHKTMNQMTNGPVKASLIDIIGIEKVQKQILPLNWSRLAKGHHLYKRCRPRVSDATFQV